MQFCQTSFTLAEISKWLEKEGKVRGTDEFFHVWDKRYQRSEIEPDKWVEREDWIPSQNHEGNGGIRASA